MKTYSEILADYVSNVTFENIPHDVVEKTKCLIIDTLGVMVQGSDTPWSLILLNYFQECSGRPEADVVFHPVQLPASAAAFVNGCMAHSFDYDDDLASCHIACCVIPTALAIGQKVKASGKELIASIVIGYDVTVRVAQTLDGDNLFGQGYHPTSVCGTFGAVATASKLLGLSREQIVNAMGIAGSFPSGNIEWLTDGSMTKRFHGGKAASEGIVASSLAKNGFLGPRSIFEGANGILRIFRAKRKSSVLVDGLSQRFDILNSYIKWYPCCTCNAPAVDAVIELKKKYHLIPEEVKDVEVRVRKIGMLLVGEPLEKKQKPKTILDAQMSAPYCVAAALLAGELFSDQFTMDKINDPTVLKLARKVKVIWDPELDVPGNPRPAPAKVIIKMFNDRILEKRVDYQKGTYRNPLSIKELKEKYSKCIGRRFPEEKSRSLLDMIGSLETIKSVDKIKLYKDEDSSAMSG